jgi:cation:H+ antiporter
MQVLILVLSLCAITAGAEMLVRGATVIALRMGLSSLFVGLTIVGFGTSSPELGASLFATLEGSNEVSVGNVVGSNIFNIGLILGATALLKPIRVRLAAVRRDLLVAVAASTLPWAAGGLDGELPRWFGAAMVAALAAYLGLAYRSARRAGAEEALAAEEVRSTFHVDPARRRLADTLGFNALLVGLGLALLFLGSRGFVLSAIALAAALGIPELVIGLTIVSAGTSLPELVTSIVAARRGNPDIAIGNVVGSNMFNLLGVLALPGLIRPDDVADDVLLRDFPVMIGVTLLLWIQARGFRDKSVLTRKSGIVLVSIYAAYVAWLFYDTI